MANEVKEWYTAHHGCMGMVPLPKSNLIRPMILGEAADPAIKTCSVTVFTRKGTERQQIIETAHLMMKGDWYIPACRMFNGVRAAGYFKVEPLRQYSKGMRNFDFRWITGTFPYQPLFTGRAELGWKWNDPYPAFEEAFNDVMQGNMLSCAFDKYWAISAYRRAPYPVLYHKDDPIGRFDLVQDAIVIPTAYKAFNELLERHTHRKIINE